MKTIIGKYNSADVYTDLIEESAEVQIKQLCDQPFTKDCRIAIMPDVHAGAGCVIGFTANLGDLVIPNLIDVDIGCGMGDVARCSQYNEAKVGTEITEGENELWL